MCVFTCVCHLFKKMCWWKCVYVGWGCAEGTVFVKMQIKLKPAKEVCVCVSTECLFSCLKIVSEYLCWARNLSFTRDKIKQNRSDTYRALCHPLGVISCWMCTCEFVCFYACTCMCVCMLLIVVVLAPSVSLLSRAMIKDTLVISFYLTFPSFL